MSQVHDELYEVVSNVQRRQLLFALLEDSPKPDSPEELDTPPDSTKSEESIRIEYRHVHLPKLDEQGFINWFPKMNYVEQGPKFDEVESTLELLAEHHKELAKVK
ncbi:hypothetical protein [Haloterrigena turkmenica]|nr:hypothetical protein [Haloterrigena turkmenica]